MSQGLVMEAEATPWGLGEGKGRQARLWKTRLQIKPETWKGMQRSKYGNLSGSRALSVGQWGTGRAILVWGRSWGGLTITQELAVLLPPLCAQVPGFFHAAREGGSLQAQPSSCLPRLCPSAEPHSPSPPPRLPRLHIGPSHTECSRF